MGGYAFYVWGSFGITALAMLAESLLIRSQRTSVLAELADERKHNVQMRGRHESTSQTRSHHCRRTGRIVLAAFLVLNAFESNLVFFFSPTQGTGRGSTTQPHRLVGGMVKTGNRCAKT